MSDLEITPQDTSAAVEAGDAVIVDVRAQDEWDAGRIPGSSHIPLSELSARAAELPTDREVIFSCLSGARSLMAAQAFQASGLKARSLAGGAIAWRDAQLPFEGDVAQH
ncbi:MAG: rhodanese-like domain-containing protein [Solirubrobacteraceae bacterium]|nr:rhodanese-like domain-containing protein [Solirubrobacteraceae bacterium]